MAKIRIEIDGNDGVGKSTLIKRLYRKYGLYLEDVEIFDRGQLTKATDSEIFHKESGVCYIMLDADVETCQERIRRRGDSIFEKYHTIHDLTYYRDKFNKIANIQEIPIFWSGIGSNLEQLTDLVFNYIKGFKDGYNSRNN